MQSSGYSKKNDAVASIYVSGNTAIEIEKDDASLKKGRVDEIDEQKREGARIRRIQKARAKNRAAVCAAAAIGGMICAGIMVLLLSSAITYNTLTDEIESLTSELDTLTLQNDSTQYDIDSAVDLNEIIDTATNELGMVRSTASAVVLYSDAETEYINQVAEIPDN